MGWVGLLLLALGSGVLLWRLGLPRTVSTAAAAAVMLGATGYALQGQPGLAGQRPRAAPETARVDPGLSELRREMFGRYTYADQYFVMSEGLTRAGQPAGAVSVLLGGIGGAKQNAALWTALGSAYAENDANTVSPASRFAFDQALRLAPEHPGPPFFLGIANIRAGEFAKARGWWLRALRLTPQGAPYGRDIAERLVLLDRLIALEPAPR